MLKATKPPPRPQTPVSNSSDDDDPSGSEWIWSETKGCIGKNKHFRGATSTEIPKATNPFVPRSSTPVDKPPTPLAKATPRPSTPMSVPTKPVATVNVPQDSLPVLTKGKVTKKGAGKKAATKPADPMATRSQDASRAGGLRLGVGGPGQKDTRVASSHPSKT
jgi:hypothetical protein